MFVWYQKGSAFRSLLSERYAGDHTMSDVNQRWRGCRLAIVSRRPVVTIYTFHSYNRTTRLCRATIFLKTKRAGWAYFFYYLCRPPRLLLNRQGSLISQKLDDEARHNDMRRLLLLTWVALVHMNLWAIVWFLEKYPSSIAPQSVSMTIHIQAVTFTGLFISGVIIHQFGICQRHLR